MLTRAARIKRFATRSAFFGALLAASVAVALPASAKEEANASEPPAPPFQGDYSWMNGNNYQPASLLTSGPLTWSVMADTYYAYSFNKPADHTIFPTTTAPRHNEVGLNLATLGVEVTGSPDVLGKLVLQFGNYVDTITSTDATVGRGAYAGLTGMRHVQQAYVGQHLDVMHGLNLMVGLFPAFIGIDSYLPQENWSYTHVLLSDFTPFYLTGAVAQLYPRADLKTELWLVNGWQSLSKFGEGMGIGYSVNWRPCDRLSLTHNFLGGNFEADQSRTRLYTNNMAQWKYAEDLQFAKHLAVAAVADYGTNSVGTTQPATTLGGVGLMHRAQFNDQWALTLRGSTYSDPQKLVALAPPAGQSLPNGDLTATELTAGLDFRPSPWLLYRLEYRKDTSSIGYVAGPGGITPPAGATGFSPDFATSGDRLTFNTTVRF